MTLECVGGKDGLDVKAPHCLHVFGPEVPPATAKFLQSESATPVHGHIMLSRESASTQGPVNPLNRPKSHSPPPDRTHQIGP